MSEQTKNDLQTVLKSGALVCDVGPVAEALDMSVYAYYDAVKRGDAPIMPIKVGRRQKYRVADLRRVLGIEPASA